MRLGSRAGRMVSMVRNFTVFLVSIILFGCDTFYGPTFRNEYKEELNMISFTKDGRELPGQIPPCRVVNLGPVEPKAGALGLLKLVVERKGEIIHEFSEEDLKQMLEKEGDLKLWIIDPSGVRLSEEMTCSLEKKKE
jgi:hypothetical protein